MSYLFFAYSLIQLVLLVLAIRAWRRNGRPPYLILPCIAAALVYDNLIIGIGNWIGQGQTLQTLNAFRFYTHALFTPQLIVFGWLLARNARVAWTWQKWVETAVYTLAAIFIAIGAYTEIFLLNLAPKDAFGTLRYVNSGWSGPPIAAILTIIVLLVLGFAVFRATRWSWFLVSAAIMFVLSAAAASILPLANLAEVVLSAGLVVTVQNFPHIDQPRLAGLGGR